VKVGDLVNHSPSCFREPRTCGIIIETRHDSVRPALSQHRVFWSSHVCCWTEQGLLAASVNKCKNKEFINEDNHN